MKDLEEYVTIGIVLIIGLAILGTVSIADIASKITSLLVPIAKFLIGLAVVVFILERVIGLLKK